jgi:hypothetical protein
MISHSHEASYFKIKDNIFKTLENGNIIISKTLLGSGTFGQVRLGFLLQ